MKHIVCCECGQNAVIQWTNKQTYRETYQFGLVWFGLVGFSFNASLEPQPRARRRARLAEDAPARNAFWTQSSRVVIVVVVVAAAVVAAVGSFLLLYSTIYFWTFAFCFQVAYWIAFHLPVCFTPLPFPNVSHVIFPPFILLAS